MGNNICNVTHYLRLAAPLMDMQRDDSHDDADDNNTFHYKMLTLKWNTNICPDILENMALEASRAGVQGASSEARGPAKGKRSCFWARWVPGPRLDINASFAATPRGGCLSRGGGMHPLSLRQRTSTERKHLVSCH